MCGIAGYIGTHRVEPERLSRTLAAMELRGPDDRGHVRFEAGDTSIDLLHARLSIVDIDPRANQPMTREGCTLVFNGEIYNYRELRADLVSRGHPFSTDSDSEVLLRAYLEYGVDCVQHFEGMWALALYDERRQHLFLSRDRFGEKPLFLWAESDGLYFGSQVAHLFELVGRVAAVNQRHIARFLVNGYKSLYKTTEQFFEGITALPAATNLTVACGGGMEASRYWILPIEAKEMSFSDAGERVRARLIESVKLRLRADVPLAFCLSGGVDSGALASIAAKSLNRRIATFSIVDTDPRYDESSNIQATVRDLRCSNESIAIPKRGALDHLSRLIEHRAAPVYTLSYYVHSLLSQRIRARGYKVVLSGSGADELFTGYYDHFNLHLHEMRSHADHADFERDWRQHVRPVVRNPYLQRSDLYRDDPGFREHIYLNHDVFADLLTRDFHEPFTEATYCGSLLRNRMANELLHEVVPPILHEDDLNSMRCSIENRSPFLDSKLVELAYSIPARHLIRDGYNKAVLREAVLGILNDQVRLDRRKMGFNAAFRSVVDTGDADTRARLLDDGPIFDLVDRAGIERLLCLDPVPNSYSKFLFSFVSAKMFLETYSGARARSQSAVGSSSWHEI